MVSVVESAEGEGEGPQCIGAGPLTAVASPGSAAGDLLLLGLMLTALWFSRRLSEGPEHHLRR